MNSNKDSGEIYCIFSNENSDKCIEKAFTIYLKDLLKITNVNLMNPKK